MSVTSLHLWTGAVVFVSSLLQSTAGFGFSLIAVPFLYAVGMPLPDTVMVSLTCSFVQRILSTWRHREFVDWKDLGPMVLISILFLPLGTYLLHALSRQTQTVVYSAIGLLILFTLLLMQGLRIQPRPILHRAWSWLSAAGCGVFTGFANIGGPPVILWIQAHLWSNEKMRVTTQALTLPLVPFQILLLTQTFGAHLWDRMLYGLCFIPVALAGGWTGLHLGDILPVEHLRKLMTFLLILTAVSLLIKGLG